MRYFSSTLGKLFICFDGVHRTLVTIKLLIKALSATQRELALIELSLPLDTGPHRQLSACSDPLNCTLTFPPCWTRRAFIKCWLIGSSQEAPRVEYRWHLWWEKLSVLLSLPNFSNSLHRHIFTGKHMQTKGCWGNCGARPSLCIYPHHTTAGLPPSFPVLLLLPYHNIFGLN